MITKSLKKITDLSFKNRLYHQCPFLFTKVDATPIKDPNLLHVNRNLLSKLELADSEIVKPSFLRFLNGDLHFDGTISASTFYSGHQFGYYVPRLGDGRALMLGEIETDDNCFYELQLKGAGLTPFSRMGDGRAVVRSSIREYLGSAHLMALSIPTTEAFALITGDDDIYREEVEKSAIVLRVSESFLRFGHFQYLAHTNQLQELKSLVEFTIEHYGAKEIQNHSNRYVLFFQEVVKKTAMLFAHWQAVGFCHGVLNTDNMSILGLTIDYGPFGFIDHLDLDHICNHSDREGRYSFGNQPPIGLWNLEQLGNALQSLISADDLSRTLQSYQQLFHFEYRRLMKEKLGLYKSNELDDEFLRKTLNMLVTTEIDYTEFFRSLSHHQKNDKSLKGLMDSDEFKVWLSDYSKRLDLEEISVEERNKRMLKTNPKFILRNYLAQIAIEDYINYPEVLNNLFLVMTEPFSEWPEFEEWSKPAPPQFKNLEVSCSS